MKSVKELAAELGVTPQTIRNAIAKQNITPLQSKKGKGFLLSDSDAELIKSYFSESNKEERKTNFAKQQNEEDALVLLLRRELDFKNKQIEALQEENAKLTDSLAKTTESLQAAQALHGATVKQLLEMKNQDGAAVPDAADGKTNNKKWWQFWK